MDIDVQMLVDCVVKLIAAAGEHPLGAIIIAIALLIALWLSKK